MDNEPCDMCEGTGKMQTMQYLSGAQVYATTSASANESIYNNIDEMKIVYIICRTCKGTGVLPSSLKSEYMQNRKELKK
jgi:RecJ-like exonuclease